MPFDPVQTGFAMAKDVATQLITLSTGLVALTVTFTKDLTAVSERRPRVLLWSWLLHLVSIVAGVWTLQALTGTLVPLNAATRVAFDASFTFGANVRVPAAVQFITFVVGTIVMVLYGAMTAGVDGSQRPSVSAANSTGDSD